MKKNVTNDPKNPENTPMVESFKMWFRLFPNPDTAFGEDSVDYVRANYGKYYTLYSSTAGALDEIERKIMPTTSGSSPEVSFIDQQLSYFDLTLRIATET